MGHDGRRHGHRDGTNQTRRRDSVCGLRDDIAGLARSGGDGPGHRNGVLVHVRAARCTSDADAGKPMAASLAESWKESPDHLSYEFTLRKGLKFRNGDPFTAEDMKFSFERSKAAALKDHVKEVVIVDPTHVRFVMKEPLPDSMTYYGTLASAAGWIVPKNYTEKVGKDAFRLHPVGLGPYKFVSQQPGVELVIEAFDGYWGEKPSIKRLVFKSVPEATTRVAMLKRGEVDVDYLLDASLAQAVKEDPNLHVAFSGGLGTYYLDFFDMWDPKSPWHDERVRKAASWRSTARRSATPRRSAPSSRPAVS
jgi:peptide/nickel transport system substrate-binding protein